jgi:hypothetical protein
VPKAIIIPFNDFKVVVSAANPRFIVYASPKRRTKSRNDAIAWQLANRCVDDLAKRHQHACHGTRARQEVTDLEELTSERVEQTFVN